MQRDKMVYMANQIAAFFKTSPMGAREAGFADHINKYWEPRMRTQLFDAIDAGKTEGLDPLVLQSLPAIRRPEKPLEERASKQG